PPISSAIVGGSSRAASPCVKFEGAMGKGKGKRNAAARAKAKGATAPRSGMRRDIAAVVLMAGAAVLGLALLTFSSSDGPLVARGLPAGSNLIGPTGHRMATALYRVLGFAALVVP